MSPPSSTCSPAARSAGRPLAKFLDQGGEPLDCRRIGLLALQVIELPR